GCGTHPGHEAFAGAVASRGGTRARARYTIATSRRNANERNQTGGNLMDLKPWREIAVPHEDVHKGTFVQAEFAADITRVHDGSATAEYQDPALFFQRTFITEGMAALLTSVAKRLAGKGGDPVIQLQTAFGG